jgi:hypothetical protein
MAQTACKSRPAIRLLFYSPVLKGTSNKFQKYVDILLRPLHAVVLHDIFVL